MQWIGCKVFLLEIIHTLCLSANLAADSNVLPCLWEGRPPLVDRCFHSENEVINAFDSEKKDIQVFVGVNILIFHFVL
jgi:hypothetical protein